MSRALLLDNDPKFIIAAQKLFPHDTEWLATADLIKADELVEVLGFDVIIVRKKNQGMLWKLLSKRMQKSPQPNDSFNKQLIVLPRFFWKGNLRTIYKKSSSTYLIEKK